MTEETDMLTKMLNTLMNRKPEEETEEVPRDAPSEDAPLKLDTKAFLADAAGPKISMPPEAPTPDSSLTAVLAERGSRYGKFSDNSIIFDRLLGLVLKSPAAQRGQLTATHIHALSNISTKLARILTGDPNYDDNWRDIAGYAELMVRILNGEER